MMGSAGLFEGTTAGSAAGMAAGGAMIGTFTVALREESAIAYEVCKWI